MTFSTYGGLKTKISDFLQRSDLADMIPGYISLFEARFNRTARFRQMEAAATLTAASSSYALPADIAHMRSVTDPSRSPPVSLSPCTPDQADSVSLQTGQPVWYYIMGTNLYTIPYGGGSINIRYHQKLTGLSADGDSNWLLLAHPDLYFFGALIEAMMESKEDPRAATVQARYDRAFSEVQRNDASVAWAGSRRRIMGVSP